MNWMIENKDQPFPDTDAIELLVQQTGLSSSQIVNWTTNVRKRNRKATCENGKKPHHFLDFLFLVHDREMKKANAAVAQHNVGKLGVNISEYNDECPVKYGESPRIAPNTLPFGAPNPQATLTASTGGAFVFPSGPTFPPAQGHLDQYIPVQGTMPNKYMMDCSDNIDNAVRDTGCCEPIPLLAPPSNDDIMFDFAHSWLGDNRLAEKEDAPNFMMPYREVNDFAAMDGHILPSVTDDSHDNFVSGRYGSLSLSLGNLIDDDDMLIEEWALYSPTNV
jgi:hypothetical protein